MQIFVVTLASIVIAFLTAIIFMKLFIKCPETMVKLNIGFFLIFVTSFLIFATYALLHTKNMKVMVNRQQRKAEDNHRYTFIAILWFFYSILLCILACCWKRIIFLSNILKLTGQFLQQTKVSLSVPIIGTLVSFIMLTCYIYSNIWLFSTQKMTFIKHTYPKVDKSNLILTALGLSTFFYAWMGIFLTHWKNFVLYSLSCYWYFSSSKESLNGFKSLRRCLKDSILHTGTIAFGSFIMLVVTTIRKMLEEAAKNAKDNNSGVMYFFSCCI
jgi:Plasma-membrane choline transporter